MKTKVMSIVLHRQILIGEILYRIECSKMIIAWGKILGLSLVDLPSKNDKEF